MVTEIFWSQDGRTPSPPQGTNHDALIQDCCSPNTLPLTVVGMDNDGQWETLGGASRTGFSNLLKWIYMTGLHLSHFLFSFFLPILPREVALQSPGRGKRAEVCIPRKAEKADWKSLSFWWDHWATAVTLDYLSLYEWKILLLFNQCSGVFWHSSQHNPTATKIQYSIAWECVRIFVWYIYVFVHNNSILNDQREKNN